MIMKDQYDTSIKIIGSIPDYHLIIRAFEEYFRDPSVLHEIIVNNNEFQFRTEKSRKRFLSVINATIIKFKNKDHEDCNEPLNILRNPHDYICKVCVNADEITIKLPLKLKSKNIFIMFQDEE